MIGEILGHYRIVERLGEGGMGVVYKAQDLNLDRFVAIKILHPDKTGDDVRRRRFELEAKTASSLQHPNIVTIYDIARERDVDYIVMEYLPGRTMDSVAARRALPLKRALNFAIQIAGALAKAHSAGIVHRDLKPANIMVLEDDQIKVLDFGLAKLTEEGEASGDSITRTRMDLTTDGITVGTAAYMSPEQIEGWKVDTRSDIFSFGTLLYEMLSGERAFSGGSQISTLSAILTKDPEPISDLPLELNRMLRRCLQKEPDRRFQSMADLRLGLEELRDDIQSGRLPSLSGNMAVVRRTRQSWAAVLVLATLVLAAAAYLYWQSRSGVNVPLHPVQITSYPGEEGVPTLSPDGSQVAFVWEGPNGDNLDIYVRIVAGGEPLRLTTDPNPDGNPSWSPDGRWIAYRNRLGAQSRYFLISPLGGRPHPLITLDAPQGADHSWSPDSRHIVLSGIRDNLRRLVKVDVQTREVTPISYPDGGPGTSDLTCAVSPSGEHIAFFRLQNRQEYRLLIIPFEGGPLKDEGVPVMYPKGLAWTPNGRELVFGARAQALTGLWRVKASGRNRQPTRLLGAGENGGEPAFAAASAKHGVRLVYTRSEQELSLSILDLQPDGRVVSEPRRIVSEAARVFEAQLSPDGRNLAFVSDRLGGSQIWISDPSVVDARQITRMDGPTPGAVRWSPDGSTLVFDARDTSQSDIYTVSADGGPPVRVTSVPSREARPSFSADGKWIYFRSDRGGSREVWKMPRAGGEWIQMTKGGGNEALESPDGKYLLYTKVTGGLYMMPSSGGESTVLSAVARPGLWSLAANWVIWFESALPDWSTGAFKEVHIFDLKTKKKWIAGSVSVRLLSDSGQISLSADHRSLYVIRRGQQGDLFLVDDFQ